MKQKIYYLVTIFVFSLFYGCSQPQQVKLILDTDLGPDFDDVGAMALMHALADSGKAEILATLSSNLDERVIPCLEVINSYFNRPEIPVGAAQKGPSLTTWHKEKWTDILPAKYPHKTVKTTDAPAAVNVYRKILSEQPNNSITICTIGFFTNLRDLLASKGDEHSALNGKELVAKKVKRLVSMAGYFPNDEREFNVYMDAPAAKYVSEQWPTEIIFSGFEIGKDILTGTKLIKDCLSGSPIKDAYEISLAEGDKNGRMSWDQTAVLVAINGYEPYFDIEKGVFSIIKEDGTNHWEANENGKHIRLIERISDKEMADAIERYMMHRPIRK